MLVDIAIGKNRNSATWQNKQISFEDLKNKCREPFRTHMTYKQYMSSSKSVQDETKDVGAFFPGYLVDGKRSKGNVMFKQVVALDADFAKPGLWDDFVEIFGAKAFMYTTHKHCAAAPRMRLVILCDRPMEPEEYEPVCRYIAGLLGIDQFDPTGYEVNRFLYWPAAASDGEFEFGECDGAPLDVDGILGTYRNWKDISEWPRADNENIKIRGSILKQGEPTEKPGAVGLFCRTYTVEDAISRFLPDKYVPYDDGRYSYVDATTSGGAVVYDDGKFIHSHHASDPISGQTCNAFQLVLVHKFGHLDENARPDTPVNRLPSFTAMVTMAMQDERVKRTHMAEKLADIQNDFGDVEIYDASDLDWMSKLETMARSGELLVTYHNVGLIMRNDPRLRGRFRFNEFSGKIDVMHPTPWNTHAGPLPISDDDERGLRDCIGREPYNLKAPSLIDDVYPLVAKERSYHPIKEFLESLVWDCEERVDTLLTDYLGAQDNELNRAFIRKWLCGAIARVYEPGTKFDNTLTLVGAEGARKSTLARSLGVHWFSDTFNFSMMSGGNGVRAYEQIRGKWIIEIPEMAGLRKAEIEAAKGFLAAEEDTYRVSHGKNDSTFKRQCMFIGTTNNFHFLIGTKGNRRFWPVLCDVVPRKYRIEGPKMDPEIIKQVWAEAMLIRLSEPLSLSDELTLQAKALQGEHTERDEREGLIAQFLEMDLPEDWETMEPMQRRGYFEYGSDGSNLPIPGNVRNRVCAAEIWVEVLGGDARNLNAHNTRFIHDLMRKTPGWEAYKSLTNFKFYGSQRAYRRVDLPKMPKLT